jgi:hypothetical protein
LQTARLLAVTLLVIAPALAESGLADQPARESGGEINSTTVNPTTVSSASVNSATVNSATVYTTAAVPPLSLPDAPAPQRLKVKVIDKKFIFVMGALGGAESLRFTTHKLVLDHEFAAGAPWVTSVPPNQHLVAKYAGIYAAELLVAYELKKPHSWLPGDRIIRKLWWVYPAIMVPIHIKNGVRSIRTQAPSCPVDECQEQ